MLEFASSRRCVASLIALAASADIAFAADVFEAGGGAPVQVRNLHVFDDAGTLIAVQSDAGDLAVRRLDPEGEPLWTWAGPVAATLGSGVPFALRPDGSILAVSTGTLTASPAIVTIDANGVELDRWTPDFPTARPPVLLPDGLVLDQALQPPRLGAFAFDGTPGGIYALQPVADGSVSSLGARGWPSGHTTLREQHRDADQVPTFVRLAVLDAAMTRIGHYDLAGMIHSERELADQDVVAAGTVGTLARFVRISPAGAVRWEASVDPGQSRVPSGLRMYEHAGGLGFVGRASLPGSSCVLHGTLGLDGSAPQSTCETIGSTGIGELLAERDLPGGKEIVFFAVTGGEPHLVVVAKQGAAPITTRVLAWDEATYWFPVAAGLGAGGVVAALEGGSSLPESRLLRWGAGPAPDLDERLAGEERLHRPANMLALPGGDVLSVATAPGELHLVRTRSQGDAVWDLAVPDLVIHSPAARAAGDGSVRVLAQLANDVGALYAVGPGGQLAWKATLQGIDGLGSIEVDGNGATVLGYTDLAGGFCRFQRFDASGTPGAQQAIVSSGSPHASAQLADGRTVWNCGANGVGLQLLDAGLAVTDVTASCPIHAQALEALGANRWVAVGTAPAAPDLWRVCLFDGTQYLRGAEFAQPGFTLRASNVDAAGNVWLTMSKDVAPTPSLELVHHRFMPESAAVRSWPHPSVLTQRLLFDVAAPDWLGRIALLLGPLGDGEALEVQSARPGEAPEWSTTLPVPKGYPRASLLLTDRALLATYPPVGTLDGIVLRVAPLHTATIMADGFEASTP